MKAINTILCYVAACRTVAAFTSKAFVPKEHLGFALQVFKPLSQSEASDLFRDSVPKVVAVPSKPVVGQEQQVKLVRHADTRKKWGVDNVHVQEYWFDNRIHTLGNIGISGALHAALAPISTKLIDVVAYNGRDVRAEVAEVLSKAVGKSKARVLDLCCGVGISTRALHEAFPDAETVIGLDTSPQMIAMANFLARHLSIFKPMAVVISHNLSTILTATRDQIMAAKAQGQKVGNAVRAAGVCRGTRFLRGNSEGTELPESFFDLVTIMYAFHEVPKIGRDKILAEARRLLKPGGTLAVLDISTDYTPSPSMLLGEPYVQEYQKSIHNQMRTFQGFLRPRYKTVVDGHVGMWLLQRA